MLKICNKSSRDSYNEMMEESLRYFIYIAHSSDWNPFKDIEHHKKDGDKANLPLFRYRDHNGNNTHAIATSLQKQENGPVCIQGQELYSTTTVTIPIDELHPADIFLISDYIETQHQFKDMLRTRTGMSAQEALKIKPWITDSIEEGSDINLINVYIYHNDYFILEVTSNKELMANHSFMVPEEYGMQELDTLAQAEEELFENYYDDIRQAIDDEEPEAIELRQGNEARQLMKTLMDKYAG